MKHATATAPPLVRKPIGQIILDAPEIDPQPLTRRRPFVVSPRRFTFERIQVDLSAEIPDDAIDFLADPTQAAALLFRPLNYCIREIEAAPHRDDYSMMDFRLMASAVKIDHYRCRMKQVTLLLSPGAWQAVETIAGHFGTDAQAVLRGALRIAVDRKLAESRPHPFVTATRAKAGR